MNFRPLAVSFLFGVLSLAACGPKDTSPRVQTPADAAQVWSTYSANTDTVEKSTGAFRLSASLRYTDADGKSHRVSSLLWGNSRTAEPLRLDILAGLGPVVAKIKEDEQGFLAYSPDKKTAYFHPGSGGTLNSFGVPIPLSLGDLTLILTGRSGRLFMPESPEATTPHIAAVTPGGILFSIPDAPLPGLLELADNGAPISWREMRDNGWRMDFEPNSDNPLYPRRVKISHAQGYQALIIIKDIEKTGQHFSPAQLDLPLPAGTSRQPFKQT